MQHFTVLFIVFYESILLRPLLIFTAEQVEDTVHWLDDLCCFYLRRRRVMTYLHCTGMQAPASCN